MSLRQVKFATGVVAGLCLPAIAFAQQVPVAATSGEPAPGGVEVTAVQSEVTGFLPAAYLKGAARASEASIEGWIANPSSILEGNPAGGLPMANMVRSIAGSDNRAISIFVDLGKGSSVNSGQRAAIGAGLARAAQGAQSVAPDYAAYIQQLVAASDSPDLIAAFTAALSETSTAALGTSAGSGGGVGATGGGGTVTGGGAAGGGSAGLGGSSTTSTASGSFNAGGGGSVSGTSDGLGTTGLNGGVTTVLLNASPS